ncbi:MAG TPA: TatD family hydrolase [Dehalococcoidia bacterium]|nr:TatD family hydrolase [Dehalococcoidia bacterium]
MLPLIDTHAHPQFSAFDDDRDIVLERARAAGLQALIAVGTDIPTSEAALDLAERHDWVYATAGIHPHDAEKATHSDPYLIRTYASHPRAVAVGETGLDYYRMLSSREAQIALFRAHLVIAGGIGRPVVVHSRSAADDTWDILCEWAAGLDRDGREQRPIGVMHCFEGDLAQAERYVSIGFLISIPGPVTYPNAARRQEVAAGLALDAMVVETDCPYLTPQRYRGHRNEPAYLVETVQTIASLRSQSPAEIAQATSANASRLFGIPTPSGVTPDRGSNR